MSKWTPGGIKLLAQSYSDSQWPWWDENSVLWSLESVIFPLLLCCSESASVMGTWNLCLCLLPSSWGTSHPKMPLEQAGVFWISTCPMNLCHRLTWASHCKSRAQSTVNSWDFCTTKTSNLSIFAFFVSSCTSFLLAHKSLPLQLFFNHWDLHQLAL